MSNPSDDPKVVEARDEAVKALALQNKSAAAYDLAYDTGLFAGLYAMAFAAEPRLVFDYVDTSAVRDDDDDSYPIGAYGLNHEYSVRERDGKYEMRLGDEPFGAAPTYDEAIYACNVHNLISRYDAIANGQ